MKERNFDTISTETWRVRIPSDWTEKEGASQGFIYFESADGMKGAYFSTLRFDNDSRSALEILESVHQVELNSLTKMENRSWKLMNQWTETRNGVTVRGKDYLDPGHSYRIVCKILAQSPWIVRTTFHDYDCSDYAASRQFFQSAIDSAIIHNENS